MQYKQVYRGVFFCLIGFWITLSGTVYAGETYYTIKDLSQDWQVYNKYYQSYIPISKKNQAFNKAGLFISHSGDQQHYLTFYSNKGLSLFVNNKMVYKHASQSPSQWQHVPMSAFFSVSEEDPVLIIFHNNQSGIYLDSVRLQVQISKPIVHSKSEDIDEQKTEVRIDSFSRVEFIFSFLLFTCLLIFYKYVFMKGRTLLNIGVDRNMELLLLDRSGAMSVVLILVNSILYMMLFYLLAKHHTNYFNLPYHLVFKKMTNDMYLIYLLSVFFLMQSLKIVFVKMINVLTFSSGVSPLQNYLLLNYLFQAGLFLLPFVLIISLLPPIIGLKASELAPLLFFMILVIISLLTSYMIYSRSELRNIYLFSYICTAEIMPLSIAYRVILG